MKLHEKGARRLKMACAAMTAGLLLAGCSSLNPFASKAPPRNPPAPLEQFSASLNVRTVWSTRVGKSEGTALQPAAAKGAVFAAASDGNLMRLDAASGRPQWSVATGSRLVAGVGTDGENAAVGTRDGALLVYDGNGKLRWKAQLTSEILSAPAIGEGLVIVRSLDNRISAYDLNNGNRRWTLQRTAPPLTLRAAPGLVIASDSAYVALPGGRLLALALNNGGPRWEVSIGEPRGATELERIADVSGTPVISSRDVCASAYQGRIACVDTTSGTARWARPLSSVAGVAADERFVFGVDERSVINAYTRDSGNSVWRNNKLQNRDLGTPVSIGRAVAVGDRDGFVHFLSREDGTLIARIATDGSPIAGITLAGDNLLVQTRGGSLMLLAAQ